MVETDTAKINDDGSIEFKGLFVYYYSNPESPDVKEYCVPIYTTVKLDQVPWRWHDVKPSDDLVNPVWDTKLNTWVEASAKTQTQMLAKLQDDLNDTSKKIATLQENQTKQDASDKWLDTLQQMQLTLTNTIGQMNGQINSIASTMKQVVDGLNSKNNSAEPSEPVEGSDKND